MWKLPRSSDMKEAKKRGITEWSKTVLCVTCRLHVIVGQACFFLDCDNNWPWIKTELYWKQFGSSQIWYADSGVKMRQPRIVCVWIFSEFYTIENDRTRSPHEVERYYESQDTAGKSCIPRIWNWPSGFVNVQLIRKVNNESDDAGRLSGGEDNIHGLYV